MARTSARRRRKVAAARCAAKWAAACAASRPRCRRACRWPPAGEEARHDLRRDRNRRASIPAPQRSRDRFAVYQHAVTVENEHQGPRSGRRGEHPRPEAIRVARLWTQPAVPRSARPANARAVPVAILHRDLQRSCVVRNCALRWIITLGQCTSRISALCPSGAVDIVERWLSRCLETE